MPTPTEHKTVQARILEYAQDIGWTFVLRYEPDQCCGFDADAPSKDPDKNSSLSFDQQESDQPDLSQNTGNLP